MYRKLTEKHIQEIIEKYESGAGYCSLSREYSVSEETVRRHLLIAGVYRERGARQYRVNEAFFEKIDTEEKAYWLGFISADGHVGDYYIHIQLGIKDREHLEKFREAVQSNHLIAEIKGQCNTPVAKLVIYSRRMALSLRRLGLDSNKTFNLRPCEEVPEHLLRHYWRGVVDGDGWIAERKRSNGKSGWVVGLCSASPKFLEGFKSFIIDHIPNYDGEISSMKKTLYRIRCNGITRPRQIAHILYYGASVFLSRKMELAQDVMEADGELTDWSFLDEDTLEFLFRRHKKNWASVARFFGMSPGNFTTFRNKNFRGFCKALLKTA